MTDGTRRALLAMWHLFRPIVAWYWAVVIVAVLVAEIIVRSTTTPDFSMWLIIAGTGARYWLGVVAVILMSTLLRQFVANGITRRDFFTAFVLFGAGLAVGLGVILVLGHGIEATSGSSVPFTGEAVAREFGFLVATGLAYLVTGAAVSIGFYRFGGLRGLLLMVPALLPFALAETFAGLGEHGVVTARLVPYPVALLITLVAAVLGGWLLRWELRDVAIRRPSVLT